MKKLGFGFMRLPLLDKNDPSSIDIEQVKSMTDLFMEKGFTYFDTAYPYHKEYSEAAIRKALVERYPRKSFVLADKMPTIRVTCAEDYPMIFNTQLKRCGVEYFDRYLLHNLWKNSYKSTVEFGGFDFIRQKTEEGKIKKFGFSFHDEPELLDRILYEQPQTEFVQLQVNYYDWNSPSVRAKECIEIAAKYGKEVVVMEPNKGGSLINLPPQAEDTLKRINPKDSNAKWAMRFAGSCKGVAVVLSGMSNMEQLKENLSFMDNFKPMSLTEKEAVLAAAEIIRKNAAIECTKCRYCTEVCPIDMPIPEYFDVYNSYKLTGNMGNCGMYYRRYANGRKLASQCIGCGKCENNCPQHIKIRDMLKAAANTFEVR